MSQILQQLRQLENDSNPIHFDDAMAEFLRTKNRTPEQDLELLRTLLSQIKNHEYVYKNKAINIIRELVEIETYAETYYEIKFR